MSNVILALPNECWRWIPGYEGLYQVSTRGRVRSVDRWVTCKEGSKTGSKRFLEGKILSPKRNKEGYLRVKLYRNGKLRYFKIHRLVAMAWLDNPMDKPEVNHLDEQKGNNDVYNLEWCSRKYNINYGTGIKRRAARRSKAVEAIDPNTGQVVREFPSTMEAGRNGFHSGGISNCCLGRQRTHHGLAWRYKG